MSASRAREDSTIEKAVDLMEAEYRLEDGTHFSRERYGFDGPPHP